MEKFLHERYSAMTTFSKALLHTTLARTKYTGQPAHEYVAKSESCAVQPSSMDVPMDEGTSEYFY